MISLHTISALLIWAELEAMSANAQGEGGGEGCINNTIQFLPWGRGSGLDNLVVWHFGSEMLVGNRDVCRRPLAVREVILKEG